MLFGCVEGSCCQPGRACVGSREDQEELWRGKKGNQPITGEWHRGDGPSRRQRYYGKRYGCLRVAELSLAPCCWLLFAPRIRPQHLGKIIHWSKEDREARERRRLGL